jgi:redox-sensing transcriptional repressor
MARIEEIPAAVPCTEGVPEPTLRRLPGYCQVVRRMADDGVENVSCTQIGAELHLDPTQVRKDIAFTGIVGRPRVGYAVGELYDSIESFLGWKNAQDAFLIGVGSLGTALLGYANFENHGVRIVAAFDDDPIKVGTVVHGRKIYPLQKLPNLAARMKIHMGILTVPADAAQEAANLLVESGILAIWNFAPTALTVPEDIIVQTEELFASLGVLSSKLAKRLRRAETHA